MEEEQIAEEDIDIVGEEPNTTSHKIEKNILEKILGKYLVCGQLYGLTTLPKVKHTESQIL